MVKKQLKFNEEFHRYTDEDNNIYTSVTTLIKNYEIPFDENYWAKYKADKLGISVEAIKANWNDIRTESGKAGTKEHLLLENSINASLTQPIHYNKTNPYKELFDNLNIKITSTNLEVLKNTALATKYSDIYLYLEKYILDGWSLYSEKRVYWHEYLIAGTIDCLLIKGKEFIIVDWKTNKDILNFKSGYYKKVNGIKSNIWVDKKEYFKKPIHIIEFCKGNIYTLQLSLYAYILELWGYSCYDLQLYHIKRDDTPKRYKINYLKSACQLLLIDSKNKRSLSKSSNSNNIFGIK